MSTLDTQLTVAANDQLKLVRRVETAAVQLAGKVQKALSDVMPPILEPEEAPPDLRAGSLFVARWLGWRRQRLEVAEALYARELRADQRLRQARDEARDGLIQSMRVVQSHIELTVGKGRSGSFAGFAKGLHELDTAMLLRVATQAVEELRSGGFGAVGGKAADGKTAQLAELVRAIEQPLGDYARILDELPPSLLRTEAALQDKQAELALLIQDNRRLSAFLTGCYRLAGLEFHAERLRPKTRASGEAEEELPEPEAGKAADPGAAAPAPANDSASPALVEAS